MLGRQGKVTLSIVAIVWLNLGAASETAVTDGAASLHKIFLEYLTNLPRRNLVNRPIVVEKGVVVVGNRRLLISPVIENFAERRGKHYSGVRFDITIDKKRQLQLTHGTVGIDTSPKDAARDALTQWDFGFGRALFRAVAQVPADIEIDNFSVYTGGVVIKGETPDISLEIVLPIEILDLLSPMLPRRDGSLHTIQFFC